MLSKSALATVVLLVIPTWAGDGPAPPDPDLMDARIEDLMNTQVVSVAKRNQRMSKTPAAVFVITQEEIRRSGMSSVPDLLRLVPGAQVARIDSSTWAVSIRGFNDEFSNKLLVLVDGRSVYSELMSGVFWDSQEMMLENIEQIEVIRGPGAATWGANAVNGVINIITKHARATQGGLAVLRSSSDEPARTGLRWGGRAGDAAYYRVFGEYGQNNSLAPASILSGRDWWNANGGFRADWNASARDSVVLEGGAYRSGARKPVPDNSPAAALNAYTVSGQTSDGGHLLGRWEHVASPASKTEFQVYYDRNSRPSYQIPFSEDTLDLDFQHFYSPSDRHELSWGGGYRHTLHQSQATESFRLNPSRIGATLANFFVQDEFAVVPDRLSLMAGIKTEHNSFTGFELEPTARILWSHDEKGATWAAVSRAVRTPSMVERYVDAAWAAMRDPMTGLKVLAIVQGNPNFSSEDLTAYEIGHRRNITARLYADVSLFYNRYHHLGGVEPLIPTFVFTPTPYVRAPLTWGNDVEADSYGGELMATWSVLPRWRLAGGYSRLTVLPRVPASRVAQISASNEGRAPSQQGQIASYLDLSRKLRLDAFVFMTGSLPPILHAPEIPAYVRADLQFGWKVTSRLELSVGGQNLLQPRHPEMMSFHLYSQAEAQRTVLGSALWRF